jgi:hypothetical protein
MAQMLSRKDFFLKMDKGEVRKYQKEIDSLIKAHNLRFKEVKTVDKVIYRNIVKVVSDTILMFVRENYMQPLSYVWEYKENCFDINGQVWDSLLIINSAEYNDSIYTIYFRKRPHRWYFLRWGKWQYEMKSESTCGDTQVKRIFFEK